MGDGCRRVHHQELQLRLSHSRQAEPWNKEKEGKNPSRRTTSFSRPKYSSQSPGPRGGRQLERYRVSGWCSAEFTVTGLLHELGITSAFGGRNVCVGLSVPQT